MLCQGMLKLQVYDRGRNINNICNIYNIYNVYVGSGPRKGGGRITFKVEYLGEFMAASSGTESDDTYFGSGKKFPHSTGS